MSKLNLIWHTHRATKKVDEPVQAGAVLSRTSINLNSAALCLLSNPETVALAYDADSKVIAIKSCSGGIGGVGGGGGGGVDESLIVYDATKKLKNGSVTIRSKDFMSRALAQMGLELEGKEKIVCPASFNSRHKLLIVQAVPLEVID